MPTVAVGKLSLKSLIMIILYLLPTMTCTALMHVFWLRARTRNFWTHNGYQSVSRKMAVCAGGFRKQRCPFALYLRQHYTCVESLIILKGCRCYPEAEEMQLLHRHNRLSWSFVIVASPRDSRPRNQWCWKIEIIEKLFPSFACSVNYAIYYVLLRSALHAYQLRVA